jgi:D-serine deaminase-like pyridoxal phosphate-dependent protein
MHRVFDMDVRLLEEFETPLPVIDLDRAQRNLDRMADYTSAHGLALRPHVKTHKSPLLAAEQMRRGAVGLTCATTREVQVMSDVASDLLVMYPPVGNARLQSLFALPTESRLMIALDSVDSVGALALAAREAGRDVRVLVEVDAGMHRVGVAPGDAVTLARAVRDAGPHLDYAGIAFYPGHVRSHLREQGEQLATVSRLLESALALLVRAGLEPLIVSGGSTPAAWRMHELTGLTEVRPGTYIFNDRITAELGACAWEDCALTVLATVISTSVAGQAVVDAGTKALGREPLASGVDGGYGALLEDPSIIVRSMSEEHGILDLRRTGWRPRVGDRIRLVPNHACIVVHLNDALAGVRGERLEGVIPVAARGRTLATAQ